MWQKYDIKLVILTHYILCQELNCRSDNMSQLMRQFVI